MRSAKTGRRSALLGWLAIAAGAGPAFAQCAFERGNPGLERIPQSSFSRDFRYLEPGVHFPRASFQDGNGNLKSLRHRRFVAAPGLRFPFEAAGGGAAGFMQSMVFSWGGMCGPLPERGPTHPLNLSHPDRDTFGEVRSSANLFVSDQRGHQGCDIRSPSGRANVDKVVAAEAGKVVKVVPRSGQVTVRTKSREQGGSGTDHVYLHLDPITVAKDANVEAGDELGRAGSKWKDRTDQTVPHLHFEIRVGIAAGAQDADGGTLDLSQLSAGTPLPCYPSLVAAKMRSLGHEPTIIGDQLQADRRFEMTLEQFQSGRFEPSRPDTPLPTPPQGGGGSVLRFDSAWRIDNPGADQALLGLVKGDGGSRRLYLLTADQTFRPSARTRSLLRPQPRLVFDGREINDRPAVRSLVPVDTRTAAGTSVRWRGKLTWLDYEASTRTQGRGCPARDIDAEGPLLDRPHRVELAADVPVFDSACKEVGKRSDVYVIVLSDTPVSPGPPGPNPPEGGAGAPERKSIAEVTRNWGAITMSSANRSMWMLQAVSPKFPNDPDPARRRIPEDGYRWVYVGAWPGLRAAGERTDSFGDTVPAFETDEAGVALWWFWVKQRKRDRFAAAGNPTLQEIARIYGGDNASPARVQNYLTQYLLLARDYFKPSVPTSDTPIRVDDPEQRFALAWTMFHHEAGRRPVIDRATFDRGVRLGDDLMARRFERLCLYTSAGCAGQPLPPLQPLPDDVAGLRAQVERLAAVNERLSGQNSALRAELDRTRRQLEQLVRARPLPPRVVSGSASGCSGSDGWLFCSTQTRTTRAD